MLIEIKAIFPDGTIIIKKIRDTGELPEKKPVEGKKYTVYFEPAEPDPVPEFNR